MYTNLNKEEAFRLHDIIYPRCGNMCFDSDRILITEDGSRVLASKSKLSEMTSNVIYAENCSANDYYITALYSDTKNQINAVYSFIINSDGGYVSPNSMIFNNYPGVTKTLPRHLFETVSNYANGINNNDTDTNEEDDK